MKYIEMAENIDKSIIEYGNKMIHNEQMDTYENSIFHNLQVSGHAWLYKNYNDIMVWLISDIDTQLYKDTTNDYLKSNETEHGKLVYKSYQKNKSYFENDYFGDELRTIKNKEGLLFIQTKKNDDDMIYKVCYFHPFPF